MNHQNKTHTDTDECEKVLRSGIEILANSVRNTTSAFFLIGRWFVDWKAVRGYNTIKAAAIDAAERFGRHGFTFDYHWYTDAAATLQWPTRHNEILIENAVHVTDVRALLHMPRATVDEWIGRIVRHDAVAPFGIWKSVYGKQRAKKVKVTHRESDFANNPAVEIRPFDGEEFNEDGIVIGLASLISRIGIDRYRSCEGKALKLAGHR